jgi:hypothetical protein
MSEQGNLSYKAKASIHKARCASCYYCRKRFLASAIREWVDEGETALCPHCGTDSVVPGRISHRRLQKWYNESFDTAWVDGQWMRYKELAKIRGK